MVNSEIKTCHECGQDIDAFKYNMPDYVYKYDIRKHGKFIKSLYFCSYKCYNDYLTRLENKFQEKEFNQ